MERLRSKTCTTERVKKRNDMYVNIEVYITFDEMSEGYCLLVNRLGETANHNSS